MADAKNAAAIEGLTFEQAMKELEDIVKRLENGTGDLDSSINDYIRGTALQQHCQKKLEAARLKIESIMKGPDGAPALAPFESQNS